jgi:pimeloyl-ACP methyl ester carboxylesterase
MAAGDFWHVRGALPVGPLNAVLRELRGWRQPTLMLVGNHDQVPTMLSCNHRVSSVLWPHQAPTLVVCDKQ